MADIEAMTIVTGAGSAVSSPLLPPASSDPVSVAQALMSLRLRPGSTVAIVDTLANIQKNLDTLQGVASRITGLSASGASQPLAVSAAQYQKDAAILAKWGAGDGNQVEVTGVSAGNAMAFAQARPAWVSSITVSDSSANLQRNLDGLQTLASAGTLRQIVHTGASSTLKISAAQLAADQDALGLIKNQAYTLAITNASVSDTLGLDGQAALSANGRVKSIDVRDGTDAIEANLDSLQRVGLKLKSISQTDADNPLTLTGAQYTKDAIAIGKILTGYQLDVIRASAAQVAKLAANQKVVTVSVADSAANIARRWPLMQRLADSLTAIEVTDADHAINLTSDQLALGEGLLSKFTDDADHGFKFAVSGVRAGQAAAVAAIGHVASVKVADSADNIAANLDTLQSVDAQGLLAGVSISGKKLSMSMDASRLLGDQASGTQGVLDKISTRNYGIAVTNAALGSLGDLAGHAHVVAIEAAGSSDEIEASLGTLQQLGRRLTRIEQSDSGQAIDVTHAEFQSHAAVLAKVAGGYSVNVSGASAGKALIDAMNSHVASIRVADSGRNLVAHWNALRAIGSTLAGVSKTDDGALALSAASYLSGQNDGLLGRFSADQKFAVSGASVAQAAQIGQDDAVEQLEVTDDGSAVVDGLADLSGLATAGKLHGITLNTTATRLSMHASQLEGAQGVLDLVKGGRYTLALDQVAVADAAGLLGANGKIATMMVEGDAAAIAEHLADLGAAGHKLLAITRTDSADSALVLSGISYEQQQATLAKIVGGYQAELTDVAAAKAAGFAAGAQVRSLQVSDSGANLAAAWNSLGTLGAKLAGVAQTDDSLLALSAAQWANGRALGDKFSSALALSISGADVGEAAALADDTAVQQVQVSDNADAIAGAWSDLAAQSKITQIQINDPATALALSAETFAASSDLIGRIKNGQYSVALADVAVADAQGLQADSHVSSMDVTGSSSDIAAGFGTLASLDKLASITLSDDNGTLALDAAQVLGGADTLAKISNGFQIAASGASMADLEALQAVEDLASVGVSDSAANVSEHLDDLVALGATLASVHLADDSPVLALTQPEWSAAASTLAKIDGAYQVDLSLAEAGTVDTLAADATVRQIAVADTAGSVASHWGALVAAYDGGAGKLASVTLADDSPLTLSEAQQTEGAAMIAALLPDETILTAG